jgi:hypothetical protein
VTTWRQRAIEAEAEVERLRELVAELADEVEADIRGRYCNPDGTIIHAAYQRKLDADMVLVDEARAALQQEGE